MALIYIVEDDVNIREIETFSLKNSGYTVMDFECAKDFYHKLSDKTPDLILLDIMLPDEDGLEILRKLRKNPETRKVPIIMVTAKTTEIDKVKGLDSGADDYLTKPFHFEELEARIRSLTRRRFIQENVCLKCGRITFDTRTRKTHIDHEELSLTRKESALLEYFILHQNRIISPEELIEHIWDGSVNSFSNSIRVHISSLRKKLRTALGSDPIQNKVGQGYILMEDLK